MKAHKDGDGVRRHLHIDGGGGDGRR
jgi:hypothetical protein